jgi:hypothetical protein
MHFHDWILLNLMNRRPLGSKPRQCYVLYVVTVLFKQRSFIKPSGYNPSFNSDSTYKKIVYNDSVSSKVQPCNSSFFNGKILRTLNHMLITGPDMFFG